MPFYALDQVRRLTSSKNPSCRQHAKKTDHQLYQSRLQKQNPKLKLEKPFISILRIADLCWEEKRLVFEIQCSPITAQEVRKRKEDYLLEGYRLIWLLDDRLFGKRSISDAEEELLKQGTYYLSPKRFAPYDRFEVIHRKKRIVKGAPLPIDLTDPYQKTFTPSLEQLRLRSSPLYFSGDLYDRIIKEPKALQELRNREKKAKTSANRAIWSHLKSLFWQSFEYLLRKSL